MLISILKYTFIYFLSFYICHKLDKTYDFSRKYIFIYFVCSLFLSFETYSMKILVPEFTYLLPVFTFFVFFSLCTKMPSVHNFSICLISLCLNLLIFSLISLVSSVIFTLASDSISASDLSTIVLITCAIYPPAVFFLFKIRRLSSGLFMSHSSILLHVGTFLSIITLAIYTSEQLNNYTYSLTHLLRILLLTALLIIFFLWWKVQITNSYRRKLLLLELSTLRTKNNEQQDYIHSIEAENQRLGKIIHKDNRIVNAMSDAVRDYLANYESAMRDHLGNYESALKDHLDNYESALGDDFSEKGKRILAELDQLFDARQSLLDSDNSINSRICKTNKIGIDALLSYMQKEAASYQIELSFNFEPEFFNVMEKYISENDIVHLLSDLLENAVIATRYANAHKIELTLTVLNNIPAISVSDSGIAFEIDTYMNLGITNASTHLDSGGHGIGLIDIWNIKKNCMATLCIEELPSTSVFTKRISIMFDNKNRYIISSSRSADITAALNRADLTVLQQYVDSE